MSEDNGIGPKRRRRRSPGAPTVVFLDDWKWNAFFQLATPLRRAGIRTVRLTTSGLLRSHVSSWLLFDRYAVLPQEPEPDLEELLRGESIVDVQYSETMAHAVPSVLGSLHRDVAERLARRLDAVDKLAASHRFAHAGIRTPATVPVGELSPQEVAAKFGFPVVVKPKVGCGGANVTIAQDLADLEAATSVENSEDLYYEEFVTGTKLDYAAVVGPTEIEQEIAYRVLQWQPPVGRATEVETIDDPQLVTFGRQVIGVAQCTGLVNMDVIRDAQGLDWLIDFNPRAFGATGNFRAAGLDTSQGYLRAIGQRTAPATRTTPRIGVHIDVFPTTLEALIGSGSIWATGVAFMRQSAPFFVWLGWRYWLSEALSTAMSVASARAGRRR